VRFRAAQGSAWYRDHWLVDDVRIGEREPLPDLGFPFDDDLESGAGHWEPAGQWTLAAGEAYSGTCAWSLNPNDEYQRNTDFALELSRQITIPAGAQLAYHDHFSLASNTTVYVEITADDGLNWTALASYTAADNDDAWTLREHALDAHAGETIRLRFRAVQGSAWHRDVWIIDEVRIEDAATAAALAGTPAMATTDIETPTTAAMATPTKSSNLALGDLALLLLAPLGLLAASGRRRKKRWWSRPVAVTLLAVAVVSIGMALTPGSASATAAGSGPAVTPEKSLLLAPVSVPAAMPPSTPSSAPSAQHTPPVTTTRVISYTYDPLGRLTSADYSTGESFGYGYDAVGNRVALTTTTSFSGTAVTTYTYDAANRLTAVDGVPSQAWDARGNLVSNGTFTYTYNAAGQLVSVAQGGMTYTFAYNGLGGRVGQTVDGVAVTYTLDLAAGLTQVLDDGTNTYLYGLGRIGEEQSGGWTYHLPDGLGSVRQLVGGNGYVSLAQSYRPYGKLLESAGTGSTAYGYTGEWTDDNGLVFLRARYLDTGSGRFLTRDPWGGSVMRPGTLNGFGYVNNNPVRLVDPLGLCEYDPHDPYIDYDCWVLAAKVANRDSGHKGWQWWGEFFDYQNLLGWFDEYTSIETVLAEHTEGGKIDGLNALIHYFETFDVYDVNLRLESLLIDTAGYGGIPIRVPTFQLQFGYPRIPGGLALCTNMDDQIYYETLWRGDSSYQVSHFLTAVAMAYYNYGGEMPLSTRAYRRAFDERFVSPLTPDSGEAVALRLMVGHELVDDRARWAPVAQYQAADEHHIQLFQEAVLADTAGDTVRRDELLMQITGLEYGTGDPYRQGNSTEDMLLTLKGWRFGHAIANGSISTGHEAAVWLRYHLACCGR